MKKPTKPAFLLALTATLSAHGAFGQTVSCDGCTHVASVYMGEGGFIATADGADKATWVASCGGVTRSGELAASADGVVAALWTGDTACMAEKGGSFEIGPVKDGGWFWITDADNSAVGGLVAKDVLKNEAATITSAGSGVTMTAGKGAVFLREAASGRVGILSNILPAPPVDPPRKCGYTGAGTAASPYKVLNAECALGDGVAQLIATTTDPLTGRTAVVPDGGTVTRPAGTGRVDIEVSAWGNGSGHFASIERSGLDVAGLNITPQILGQPEFAMTDKRRRAFLRSLHVAVKVGSGSTEVVLTDGLATHGIRYTSGGAGQDTHVVSVLANATWCSETANHPLPLPVRVAGGLSQQRALQVTPEIRRTSRQLGDASARVVAETSFTVVCPPGVAANQGRDSGR